MPTVFGNELFVAVGGPLSYVPNQFDALLRAAEYVGLILNGAKVADLPVQDPTKFTLVVNLRAAKAQGITIPLSVSAQADQVIE